MPILPHPANYTQQTYYDCGPASIVVALGARGVFITEALAAAEAGTTTSGTPTILDVIKVLDKHLGAGTYRAAWIGGNVATAEQVAQLKADLVASVDAGYALVANVVGQATTADGSEVNSYPGGHYLAPVGYDAGGDRVRIVDVADGHEYWMTTAALATWIASRGYATAAAAALTKGNDMAQYFIAQDADNTFWLCDGMFARGPLERSKANLAQPGQAGPLGRDEIADIKQLASEGMFSLWHGGEIRKGMVAAFGQRVPWRGVGDLGAVAPHEHALPATTGAVA